MFGSIGGPELLLILAIALLIFGPKKIPELSRTIGKGMAEFRRATNEFRSTLEREVSAEDHEPPRQTAPRVPETPAPEAAPPTPAASPGASEPPEGETPPEGGTDSPPPSASKPPTDKE
jgi:TatA/E family protein of Tat protein translocase